MRIIFLILLPHLVFLGRPFPELTVEYFTLIALLTVSFVFSFDTDRCNELDRKVESLEKKIEYLEERIKRK